MERAGFVDSYRFDRAVEGWHAAGDRAAFKRRSGGAGGGEDAVAVAEDKLGVGADVHDGDEAIFVGKIDREHAGGGIGADVAADDGCAVNASFGVDRKQAAAGRVGEAGGRALALGHFDFGDRAVGILADGIDVLAEEEVAHGGVADDDHLVNRFRIDGEFLDGVGEVTGQRAHQELGGVVGVVEDARHDVRSAETLGIFERGVGDEVAGFEVVEAKDDSGGAEIHGEAVNWGEGSGDFAIVDENAIAVAADSRIKLLKTGRQTDGAALDAHLPAAHGVAADFTRV